MTSMETVSRRLACEKWARGNLADAIAFIANGEYGHARACMDDALANLERAEEYRDAS